MPGLAWVVLKPGARNENLARNESLEKMDRNMSAAYNLGRHKSLAAQNGQMINRSSRFIDKPVPQGFSQCAAMKPPD
jgi:hypothetical protein